MLFTFYSYVVAHYTSILWSTATWSAQFLTSIHCSEFISEMGLFIRLLIERAKTRKQKCCRCWQNNPPVTLMVTTESGRPRLFLVVYLPSSSWVKLNITKMSPNTFRRLSLLGRRPSRCHRTATSELSLRTNSRDLALVGSLILYVLPYFSSL